MDLLTVQILTDLSDEVISFTIYRFVPLKLKKLIETYVKTSDKKQRALGITL